MCLRPMTIRSKYVNDERRWITVPCGKCEECLKQRQNDFMIRSFNELLLHKGTFFTFTYRNDKLPCVLDKDSGEVVVSLSRKDIHQLLDATRHFCSRHDLSMPRYFICGEYGEKTFRPHAHGIFLDLDNQVRDFIHSYWSVKFGFASYEVIGNSIKDKFHSGKYVSKYTAKSVFTVHTDNRFASLMVKPFCIHSRDWGDSLIPRLKPIVWSCVHNGIIDYDLLVRSLNISLYNATYKLPTYYFKRLLSSLLQTEEFRSIFSYAEYKKAMERFINIKSLQSEFGITEEEAVKRYNSDLVYSISSPLPEFTSSKESELRTKRLRSYEKDSF